MSTQPTEAILEIPGFGKKVVKYVGGMFYTIHLGKWKLMFELQSLDKKNRVVMKLKEIEIHECKPY